MISSSPKQINQKRCEVVCNSRLCELKKIEKAIREFTRVNKLGEDIQYRLLVAATEAVNNAIIHGNKMDKRKKIHLSCCIYKTKIVVRVRDNGQGFDPRSIPDPTTEDNLLKEHGRGVFLIFALMDEVKFRKLKHGHVIEMALKI
ncbi:MAG TPA: ATP-binding protein [Bacteroidota bacterium]|nr:ATP-binding protein [Bacteroidota bacterium]